MHFCVQGGFVEQPYGSQSPTAPSFPPDGSDVILIPLIPQAPVVAMSSDPSLL